MGEGGTRARAVALHTRSEAEGRWGWALLNCPFFSGAGRGGVAADTEEEVARRLSPAYAEGERREQHPSFLPPL